MNKFSAATVLIRGLPFFTCSVCKIEGIGSTVRLELTTLDPAEIERATTNVSMSHIPEGWACFGSEDIRCPKHRDTPRGAPVQIRNRKRVQWIEEQR